MSEQIKGFSIELDLDSIKVDTGLKDVRAGLRQTMSEMRRNMSVFDRSEKSVEKYGVQLEGLNKKLEVQKKVTESARKHYEKMAQEHGEGSRQAMNAAAAYNDQAAQLNNLERHIGKVTKEMQAFKKEQEIQNSNWTKSGQKLVDFGGGLEKVSDKIRSVGSTLTKSITMPALGATTAVGGLVAAFGWSRLSGLDSAQAQLEGLGYNTEEVGRISEQVTNAIEGGMTTMAEGTAVAAGAMAAGVKEGAELERYIKLVGDAASGANRPVEDMAQIFNRVQGQGKLMTQELNMIEQGMPGFAQAMADNVADGSLEAFREMVTNGEVGTEEFLDVMDDFAGGMADAYAGSWKGMLANTKAYIGIIGENLLGGVFEKSKESVSEFIDILSSERAQEWAAETGEKLGNAFTDLVDKIKGVIKWYTNLSDRQQGFITKMGALAVAIGPVLTVFGVFGGFISKISKGLGALFKGIGKAGGAFKFLTPIVGAFTNPVGIAVLVIGALATAFVVAYKKSETFREFIKKIGTTIQETFSRFMEWIQPGIDAVVDFFSQIGQKFTEFKEQEGAQIIEAFKNIGSFIGDIAMNIWNDIQVAFMAIKAVIEFVMPFVEGIIKTVWDSIKTIIDGTLDTIMGLIKTFSGLFTGDWKKMWEGIKDIGKGLMKVIWGLVKNSFIGKIITGIGGFVKDFTGMVSGMWQDVKDKFDERIGQVKSAIENSFVGDIISSVTTMKDDFIDVASDMLSGVKDKFDDIVDGAKELPGRIGKGISNAKDKATDGMKTVGNKLIEWAGKPFNKVVDGVNWVTGKLNPSRDPIGKWDYPQYAKGTPKGGHRGGLAMIGEKGRELVKLPGGQSFVSPSSHTMIDLPKGTHVIPNKPTEQILKSDIPHFAKGTKGWFDSFKSTVGDVWDYVKNPSKIVTKLIDKISLAKGMAEIPSAIVKNGFDYVKTKPVEFIKNMFDKNKHNNPNLGGGKPAFSWPVTSPYGFRIHPITGQPKLHGGTDFGAPMGSPVPSQTAGTVSFAGWNSGGFGNLVKVKSGIWEMFYAHLSKVLVRAGQSVKKGQILGNVGSTGASTGPHLHYEKRKNGTRVNPMKGFKTGGVIKSKMMAMLGEEGEEIVIPTAKNRRTDAMKLLALAARKIGADGGSYSRSVGNATIKDNKNLEKMVAYLAEQVEDTKDIISLLTNILLKDTNLNIDGRQLARAIEGHITNIQNEKEIRKARARG